MSKLSFYHLALACLAVSWGIAAPTLAADALTCQWTDSAPTIDGKANEEAWQRAVPITNFVSAGNDEPLTEQTTARLLWDAHFLYFTATMTDDDIWAPDAQDDGNIWRNDVIELFVRPNLDSREYCEFEVNARGTLLDLRMPHPEGKSRNVPRYKAFDSGMVAAVTLDGTLDDLRDVDRSWTVEAAIPLRAFGNAGRGLKVGKSWTIGFSRCHYSVRLKKPQYSTSAGPNGFDSIDDYTRLTFSGPPAAGFQATTGLANGSFEIGTDWDQLPDGWQHIGDGELFMTGNDTQHGRRALHIGAGPRENGVSQRIGHRPTNEAMVYRVTAQVKSQLAPGTLAHLGMLYYDKDGNYIRQAATRTKTSVQLRTGMLGISGAHGWKRYVAHAYNVPPEARSLALYISVNAWENPEAAGHILVDDIRLTEHTKDPRWPLGFPPVRWQAAAHSSGDAPLAVYGHSTLEYVLPSMPVSELETAVQEVSGWGLPGEVSSLTASISANHKLENVTVSISDLSSDNGATIRHNVIELQQAVYHHRRRRFFSTDYLETPTYLAPARPIDIEANRTQQYWFSVTVPKSTPRGRYQGSLTVQAAGQPATTLPVTFNVIDAKLTAQADNQFGFYSYVDNALWPSRDTSPAGIQARVRADFADMVAHGMTTTVCFTSDLNIDVQRQGDGDIKVDWNAENGLAILLNAYRNAGFGKPLFLYAQDAIFEAARRLGGAPGSPRFAEIYVEILRQLAEESEKQGWLPINFVPADESYPYALSESRLKHTRLLSPLIKAAGFKVFQHALNHPTANGHAQSDVSYEIADVILQTFCHPPVSGRANNWHRYVQRAHARGKEVLYYNFDGTGVHPEATRFCFGLGAWERKTDGVINWCYREANNFAIHKRQGVHTMTHAFLPSGEHPGGPTIGWESTRAGVRDYRALQTLTSLIEETLADGPAPARAVALQAQAYIRAATSAVRFDSIDNHSDLSMPAEWPIHSVDEKGLTTIGGTFKINNGISLSAYDELARQVCEYIAILQQLN